MSVEQDVVNELARRLDATDDDRAPAVGDRVRISVPLDGFLDHGKVGVIRVIAGKRQMPFVYVVEVEDSAYEYGKYQYSAEELEPAPEVPPDRDAGEES